MSSVDPHYIDELLNGLIDGELTVAEEAEIRQQIERDKDLAGRLQGLTDCRTLVNSLPRISAPPELLERVRQTLERRSLLGEVPSIGTGRRFGGHLIARKVVAAAAAIGLVGILSVLVYSIVVPSARSSQPLVKQQDRPGPTAPGELAGIGHGVLTGRLEARVASLADMEMFLSRILEGHGLAGSFETDGSGDRRVYRLHCGLCTLDAVLADLAGTWHRLERPTFYLETGRLPSPIVVTSVAPDQLARIARQGTPALAMEVAREIAVLNSVSHGMPGQEVLAAIVEKDRNPWPTVAKPVLTSSDKTIVDGHKPSSDERWVNLTVVLIGGR